MLKVPTDLMPLEQCAMLRELVTAYRLLEDHAALKVCRGAEGVAWRSPCRLLEDHTAIKVGKSLVGRRGGS